MGFLIPVEGVRSLKLALASSAIKCFTGPKKINSLKIKILSTFKPVTRALKLGI